MKIGLFGFLGDVNSSRQALADAAADGYDSYWIPQAFGPDTLTMIALAGQDTGDMIMGSAVVPTYPRHPQMLAQQALTVNQAIGDRLVLGIGPSHKVVIEGQWDISFDKPIRHMREYLEILMPMLHDQKSRFQGETLSARADISVPDAPAPKVMVAALGPQLLKLTGKMTDGTITWMVGPKTLGELTVPTMNGAAADAGRATPQTVAGVPISVTSDPDAATERAAKSFAMYGGLPSYRAMLDREGYEGPGEMAIVGDEETVKARIAEFEAAGVTTFAASPFGGSADRQRTNELLKSLM